MKLPPYSFPRPFMEALVEPYLAVSLPVLALWQPWATLLVAPTINHAALPAKPHETRTWCPRTPTPFPVAIHATKKFDAENRGAFDDPRVRLALKAAGFYPGDPRPFLARNIPAPSGLGPVALGAIIGLATVAAVYPAEPSRAEHDDDLAFGQWGEGRFAWRMVATVLLPTPIPHTGRQDALYDLDLETREAINAQLRAMAQGARWSS